MSETKLVSFAVAGGEPVLVETESLATRRFVPVGNADESPKTPKSFEEALERVRPAVSALFAKISEIAVKPDEIELEFGIKLSAEWGALIAKTAGEANFTVTMRWKKS